MSERLRAAVVPAYLLLCLVLGGSTQGALTNLALQLLGIAIIAWAVLARPPGALPPPVRGLLLIAVLTLLLFLVQLLPLPPSSWSALPGQQRIAEGYRLLGQPLPWRPLSLTPYETTATVLTLVPPLAVLAAMLLGGGFRAAWIAVAILLGAFAGVLLGALQVGSGNAAVSPWYLYRQSNFGFATGFFANANHMGALLVISVPFLIALVRHMRSRARNQRAASAALILALAGVLVLAVGLALNGSLAVLLLGPPVAAVSATMLWRRRSRWLLAAGAVAAVAVLAIYFGANASSSQARERIWSTSLHPAREFAPLGSGIGSFRDVYPLYEDPAEVRSTVVNHAHNDYLEIAMEAGVPGLLLLALFLFWWTRRAKLMWKPHAADPFGQAAAIASAALLLHSLVDFPLRMPALSVILAACIALMAQPRRRAAGEAADLWPTRHLRL